MAGHLFAMLTGELQQPEGATRVPDIQEVLLLNSVDVKGEEEDKALRPPFAVAIRGGPSSKDQQGKDVARNLPCQIFDKAP